MAFHYRNDYLYCEGWKAKDIQTLVGVSPFYLYSTEEIKTNFKAYKNALESIPSVISYAVKANGNLSILRLLRSLGSWVTLVSGNELHLAKAAGFDPKCMIFNGNGKTVPELRLAIEHDVLVNIDSHFDLNHIHSIVESNQKPADVLLRIRPDINPKVHPYISTGLKESKFGVSLEDIPVILDQIRSLGSLNLVGIHCHLGSTIEDLDVFRREMIVMAEQFEVFEKSGFPVNLINLGGGLGINYHRKSNGPPKPSDLIASIADLLPANATLIVEPGRSIVGSAGILVSKVIGVKTGRDKNFIVIDSSMAELIRPSLYQAYHEISFIEPVDGPRMLFDIVGPICESADTLGKNRRLPFPKEGTGVVIFDTGAYGMVMSSNYNTRMRPAEYLIDGQRITQIRRQENFKDHLCLFDTKDMTPWKKII